MFICLIRPSSPLTMTQSPTLNGRSNKMMIPESKLLMTFCKPKPIPTERAEAINARLERLPPMTVMPMMAARIKPTKLSPEDNECLMPSSMSILVRTLFTNRTRRAFITASETKKARMAKIMAIREMLTPPIWKPKNSFLMLRKSKSVETPHNESRMKTASSTSSGSIIRLIQKSILESMRRRILKVLTQKRSSSTRCITSDNALRITIKKPTTIADRIDRFSMNADSFG